MIRKVIAYELYVYAQIYLEILKLRYCKCREFDRLAVWLTPGIAARDFEPNFEKC